MPTNRELRRKAESLREELRVIEEGLANPDWDYRCQEVTEAVGGDYEHLWSLQLALAVDFLEWLCAEEVIRDASTKRLTINVLNVLAGKE